MFAISCSAGTGGKKGYHKVKPEQFKTASAGEGTILDVRTPEEFAEGHLEGAVNMNVNDPQFKTRVESLNKQQPVYVYCRLGGRSKRASDMLEAAGFITIYDLDGGITAWNEAGLKTVK